MEGYDAKFDPPLDKRLECPICLLAQREPMQTPCGHRFCSACILRALSETGTRCPVDNTRVAVHQLFKDNFAKREVLSLHVHCHAEDHGCPWEGELRNLEAHSKVCDLVTISCPNDCGYVCQRKSIIGHLPVCSNHLCPCSSCSISHPQNKLMEHLQFCSKIKIPESVIENISKSNEVLKWCGHLKMKVHGQNYSAVGYLTAKFDSEERFIYSGCWSSNINLIPLMGAASKLFWKTLQGPEVKPVELYFGILNLDSKSNNFQKLLKKKVNAVIGLRLKPSSRRELMIMYIHWSEQQKRLVAYVAELRNYLVREMQKKLQPLRRSSQFAEFGQLTEAAGGSSSRSDDQRGAGSSRRGYGGSVRVINVPPTVPAVSIDSHSHAPSVVPSILSWQLSPNFPAAAYPWRGGPSVPFFTIPSTPPQFLPAHSYPYTFAPMPAIAAPPFSNIPIQQVPGAPLTVPSYAGVTVPQVSGLHAELVVSSANSTPMQGGPGGYIEAGSGGNPPPISHLPAGAVIHSYPAQDPGAISIPHQQVPPHPVNQVSVVVDPRLNPQNGIVGPSNTDSRRSNDVRHRQSEHWGTSTDSVSGRLGGGASGGNGSGRSQQPLPSRSSNTTVSSSSEGGSGGDSLYHIMSSNTSRYNHQQQRRLNPPQDSSSSSMQPGPSGVNNTQRLTVNNVMQSSPGSLASLSTGLNVETSDEDESDVDSSPFHWSLGSNSSSNSPQHHIQYIDPPSDFVFSESGSPNSNTTRGSGGDDVIIDHSPTSQQRAMGSALQTLADAAALLSPSPHSNSSDDGSDLVIVSSSRLRNPPSQPSSSNSHQPAASVITTQQLPPSSRGNSTQQHDPQGYPTPHPAAVYQQNPTNGVLAIAPPPPPQQANIYHPSQLATGYHHHHHPAAAAAGHAHLEELPVFLPVIHSSVDQLEAEAVGNPIVPPTDGTTGPQPPPQAAAAAVLYTPHDSNMVVTSRPLPMVDVPPLIRIATQSQHRPVIPGEQWPTAPAQQIPPPQQAPPTGPPPVPPPQANFIRPQPLVAAATAPVPTNGGGFWEDVMPSLDMRLHETHTSLI